MVMEYVFYKIMKKKSSFRSFWCSLRYYMVGAVNSRIHHKIGKEFLAPCRVIGEMNIVLHHLQEGIQVTILGELMNGGTVALVEGVIETAIPNLIGTQVIFMILVSIV